MVTLIGSFRLSTVIGLLFLSYRLMVTKRVLASRMSLAPSEYESGRKVFSDICTWQVERLCVCERERDE